MAKTKTVYVCRECGAEASKWIGKCPACGNWNTYFEEISTSSSSKGMVGFIADKSNKPQKLSDIDIEHEERIEVLSPEFSRVLGGGIVKGSVVLIGGEPGIGKSTLALQTALRTSVEPVLYISGEESANQVKLRAERLSLGNESTLFLNETNLESMLIHLKATNPKLVIIDSIQTVYSERIESSPGSVTQVRECTAQLLRYAKTTGVPILLIGHINKEGSIAGPKVLEHIVDVVLQFEGDPHHFYRILRSQKNRFGSTSEIGIFEMRATGLIDVTNPSELLVQSGEAHLSGTSVAASVDGMRPFLVEIQALVSSAVYGTPQRSATGYDIRRLNMLLAVLEKRAGFRLGAKDVFLNIAGGLRIKDPALDLSVVVSILSSGADMTVPEKTVFAAEVGLTGEIRPVSRIEQRIKEAEKLGFKTIYIAKSNFRTVEKNKYSIKVLPLSKVSELPKVVFADS